MSADVVRLLILNSRSHELGPVVHFLRKRGFEVYVSNSVRESVKSLVQLRPDWILLSINMEPMAERFVAVMKQSFKIDTILYGESLDHRTMTSLDQHKGLILPQKLTGPSIQLKIHQILNDRASVGSARFRAPPKATSGVRPSSFGHIHVRTDKKPDTDNNAIVMVQKGGGNPGLASAGHAQSAQGMASTSTGSSTTTIAAMHSPQNVHANGVRPSTNAPAANVPFSTPFPPAVDLSGVEQLSVMVAEESGNIGYLVMGNSVVEAAHVKQALKEKLIGPFAAETGTIPNLHEIRAQLMKKNVPGVGEMLSCFVPKERPLPTYRACVADKEKMELLLVDIPTDTELPCALFVYLQQNQKFVCLIKAGGKLGSTQQERLLKLGQQSLMIAKQDMDLFNRFYVQAKLSLSELGVRSA